MPRKPISELDLHAFSGAFRTESDRACAVLGGALLDARLESLFERRLLSSKDELLTGNGALSTFSARIRLAGALGWVSEDVRYDLNQIREIRNLFAHNADHQFSFADQSIAGKCQTLKVAKTLIEANEHAASIPHKNLSSQVIRAMGSVFQSPRQRFEISVEMIAQHLDELPSGLAAYAGPNLKEELWALGSRVNIKFS